MDAIQKSLVPPLILCLAAVEPENRQGQTLSYALVGFVFAIAVVGIYIMRKRAKNPTRTV